MLCLLLFDSLFKLNGARVLHFGYVFDVVVTKAIQMQSLVPVQVSTANVAVHTDGVVFFIFLLGFNHVESVCYHVGVVYLPAQRLYFLNTNKPSEVVHFCLRVLPVLLLA